MCGIAGIVAEDGIDPLDLERLGWMSDALAHRGPDGAGLHREDTVALAVRRLAIIDPNGGWQPLYNEDRSLALVANGEIYNHVELRRELKDRGHAFATGSDCETILHLYEELGSECVHRLRGMFAFALWDGRRRRLLLARDRMGEKPLYIYETPGRLVFASELRSLIRSGLVSIELDPGAVDAFLHFNYVPEPATPIRGVRKLDAAHLLVLDVEGWSKNERCYWRIQDAEPIEGNPVERVREELDEISRLTLRSDVPVGLALSGGLDSGILAALCGTRYTGDFHCFSVGYEGKPPSDERAVARRVAEQLALHFHEVELSTEGFVAAFPDLVRETDDPVADISAFGYRSVYSAAAEHGVPVMLSGQGADELFWGYPWVMEAARQSSEKAALLSGGLDEWGREVRKGQRGRAAAAGTHRDMGWRRFALARLAGYLIAPRGRLVFQDLLPEFRAHGEVARELLTPEFRASLPPHPPPDIFPVPFTEWGDVPVRVSALIARTYLRANGVVQGDRLSMSCSVEQRLPFLDHRLWEVVQGLRKVTPDHNLEPKAWLRAAVADVVPAELLRRPKRGFTPPISRWLPALVSRYRDGMADGVLVCAGIASRSGLLAMRDMNGAHAEVVFRYLVLESWLCGLLELAKPSRVT